VLRVLSAGLCVAALLSSCAHKQMIVVNTPQGTPSALHANINKQIINAVEAGDGDYTLRMLRAELDRDAKNLTARLALADRYQKLGFTEVAIEHCRLACERAPDSDEAHIALAKALREASRTPEAADIIAKYSASRASAGPAVWAWLGMLRDDLEDWKGGETAHRKALALDPARDEFHNNLGYCLLRQGKNDEAAAEFRAALRLHPHSVIAENNLALALVGNSDNSSKEAEARMQSVADPATAHNNMAVAFIEAGKYAEAEKEIAVALGYNRTHPAALNNLRLLGDLQDRPAQLPARAPSESRWEKVASAWYRFWGVSSVPPADEKKTNNPGSPVASR